MTDPDETAGRQLYRARADTLASAQVNYQLRGKALMTDIVELLRSRPMTRVEEKAVAEIERLRREHFMMQESVALGARKIEALTKANTEMRGALEEIAAIKTVGGDGAYMVNIARAVALTWKKP